MAKRGREQRYTARAATTATNLGTASLAGGALLVGLTLFAYWPSLGGGFLLDDNWYLTDAPLIAATDGIWKFWFSSEPVDYYPLSNTSLWLEWRLWGLNPTGYRATNLLLHLVSTGLIWSVLRRLSVPGAFAAALLFALHPVNVESVAWISQRKGLLALALYLTSLYAYLRAEAAPQPDSDRGRWYATSIFTFTLAVLSKGSVAVMPLIALGALAWLRPLNRRDLIRIAPFASIAVFLVLLQGWFQARVTPDEARIGGPVERLLTAGSVVWFYLYKALLPVDLSFVYPRWRIAADQLRWWLPVLGAAGVTAALWRGRHGAARLVLFAWGYFCIALLPVMGFADFGFMEHSLVADHHQHAALIAPLALLAAGWQRWQARAASQMFARAAAAAVVGALVFLTWRQAALYSDGTRLYRAAIAANPESWLAHHNLGFALLAGDQPAGALPYLERAARLKAQDFDVRSNLALAYFRLGRGGEAIDHYGAAARIRPDSAAAQFNLASALAGLGQPESAVEHYRLALELRPGDAETHTNLAAALMELGDLAAAREHARSAVAAGPELAAAHLNLGRVLLRSGEPAEAIISLQSAVRLDGSSAAARNDLGVALATVGRIAAAIDEFREALRIDPRNNEAMANLEETLQLRDQQHSGGD